MKLKYKQVKELRSKLLEQQNYRCCLCGDTIIDDAVLDHDHKTGRIRSVLHRGCNALEGKIINNMPRNRMDLHRLEHFCQNLVKYITQEYEDIIHPTYLTPEERKMKAYKKKKKGGGKK
jgi:regulator of sigma D